MGLVMLTERTV